MYSGEPLSEALWDLGKAGAILVGHELSSGTPLARTDVFRLRDGRLAAVTSRSANPGEPYTITGLRVSPDPTTVLTRRLPMVSSIPLPKR